MADYARKCFILPKIGATSFGIGNQDICKVSVSRFLNHSLVADAENYPETRVCLRTCRLACS